MANKPDSVVLEPSVSVKMITYNHASYIARAIKGVLTQKTSFPFELVIGEDCSTDGTREIVLDYQKRYPEIIRVVTSETNVGAKRNAWRAERTCRGKYIAYCEGDDYWHHPEKLQRQFDYLEAHENCGLVFSDFDVYDVKTGIFTKSYFNGIKRKRVKCPKIGDILCGKAGILTCTVMARRGLIREIIEGDPYLHQSESFRMGDTQLWAEMAIISSIHSIDESFATHNILEESAAQSDDLVRMLRFSISSSEMCIYLCNKHGLPEQVRKLHRKMWCISSLELAFLEKSKDLAENVKEGYGNFSMKMWMLYLGAKHHQLRPLVRATRQIVGLARKGMRIAGDVKVFGNNFAVNR